MKTPVKISMKGQRIAGALSRMLIQNFNHLRMSDVLLRDETIFDFFLGRGAWRHVCNTRTCTQEMSYSIYFLRKIVSHFSAQGKNIMFLGKSTIFPDSIRKIMSRRSPFGKDHPSRKFEEIIIFTCILLRKIIFHFPSKV